MKQTPEFNHTIPWHFILTPYSRVYIFSSRFFQDGKRSKEDSSTSNVVSMLKMLVTKIDQNAVNEEEVDRCSTPTPSL